MQTHANPTFSIIVPTYNRPEHLAECLSALAALDYPKDRYEVLIVDDGSDARLDDLGGLRPTGMAVRLLRQDNQGPASARNFGARQAMGKFLALTDDDCSPSPQWLNAFAARLVNAPEAMVGGATVNRLIHDLYSEASEILLQGLYAFSNQHPEAGRFFASNNIALSRERFLESGGFDIDFQLAGAEDRDFCDRWTHAGRRLISVPEAVVRHRHAHSWHSFLRQHINYGRGAVVYHRLRRARNSGGLADDVGFHLRFFHWLRAPLSRLGLAHRAAVFALILVSQAAYLCGYLHECIHFLQLMAARRS